MLAPARRPRVGFILITAMLIVFYAAFSLSNARLMLIAYGQHAGAMDREVLLAQSDYARFWYAGRQLLAGHGLAAAPSARVFPVDITAPDAAAATAWLYPPTMDLLAMGFAWMKLPLSFWVWRAVSLLLGAVVLRWAGLSGGVILAGLASLAAQHDMQGGQNGTLLGAVLVAALLLAGRRPVLAGILGGLLCVKPQIALVLPAALLRLRYARVILAAVLMVAVLVVASLAVEGAKGWWHFLMVQPRDSHIVTSQAFSVFFPAAGITPFYMLRSLGAGVPLAEAVQAAVSLVALVLVWLAWRPGVMRDVPRMALSCSLGVLAAPYGFSYDLVAFSIAMAALFRLAGEWQRLILAFLWLMGGYTITVAGDTGLLLFPLCAVCGAAIAWRLREAG